MIYILLYLIIGFILAGMPTFLDLRDGIRYSFKDWLWPISAWLLWPAALVWCWVIFVWEDN